MARYRELCVTACYHSKEAQPPQPETWTPILSHGSGLVLYGWLQIQTAFPQSRVFVRYPSLPFLKFHLALSIVLIPLLLPSACPDGYCPDGCCHLSFLPQLLDPPRSLKDPLSAGFWQLNVWAFKGIRHSGRTHTHMQAKAFIPIK